LVAVVFFSTGIASAERRTVGREEQKPELMMIAIRFPSVEIQDEAVGFLAGRFSGRLLRSGEVIVPEEALAALAAENFSFTVIGRATYDQMATIRSDAAAPIQ
jgi:hypothetical protein